MEDKQSTKQKSKYLLGVKKRILSTGTLIAILIALTPVIFYSYQGFPGVKIWESFFGTIESQFYGSIQVLVWVLFGKVIPFLLLLIWFFTCRHWWYHALLVPMAMYIFQIYNTLNDDLRFSDSDEIYFIIPIITIVAAISYTIRTRIFDRLYGVDLDQEFRRVRWNGEIVKIPADSPLDLEEVNDNDVVDLDDDDDNEPTYMG